jgi:5-methylcytosine-specific restriction endonuclease McrA
MPPQSITKRCPRCGRSDVEFGRNKNEPDGLSVWCKPCKREAMNQRYASDPEVRRKAQERAHEQRQRLDTHSPEYLAKAREYSRRHSQTEKGKEANRKRANRNYHTNPAKRAYQDGYEKQRREKDPSFLERWRFYKRQKNHQRRAQVAAAGEMYTQAEWDRLCAYYDHRCLCCGNRRPLTVDHVVPVTKGGSNLIQNLQPLCRSCNSKKNDRAIDYRPSLPHWMESGG